MALVILAFLVAQLLHQNSSVALIVKFEGFCGLKGEIGFWAKMQGLSAFSLESVQRHTCKFGCIIGKRSFLWSFCWEAVAMFGEGSRPSSNPAGQRRRGWQRTWWVDSILTWTRLRLEMAEDCDLWTSLVCNIGGSRNFERGGGEIMYHPQGHLSQMHTINCMPCTGKKVSYWEKKLSVQ